MQIHEDQGLIFPKCSTFQKAAKSFLNNQYKFVNTVSHQNLPILDMISRGRPLLRD